ncbi:hypothetical protein P775_18875 [Puniceibacterium antarcticum]|uniref:Uncharacterized protein n=1 Tax=Puniceibacterium antarcticum TaxID=1206336 RepID=A0A2G8RAP3_9RHOB|nr:hypothetical protein [Puniceibacterium antarcticum]PIL18636.1 hypothetical protein P775_18875 [Puniceibacterium antarcticum]
MTTDIFLAGLAALTLIAALIVALTSRRDVNDMKDEDRSRMG